MIATNLYNNNKSVDVMHKKALEQGNVKHYVSSILRRKDIINFVDKSTLEFEFALDGRITRATVEQ